MHNKTKKIITLICAGAVVFALVFFFIRKTSEPPVYQSKHNDHQLEIEKRISTMKNGKSNYEDMYFAIPDLIDFCYKNKFISSIQHGTDYKLFYTTYLDIFQGYCNSFFNNSSWDKGQLNKIRHRTDDLLNVTLLDGSQVLYGNERLAVENIQETINNYDDAMRLCHSHYSNIADSKSKIQEAKRLKNSDPLSNCVLVVNCLDNVANRLNYSHVEHLKRLAQDAYDYSNNNYYSASNLEYLVDKANLAINEYENNAADVYGEALETYYIRAIINQID